MASVTFDHVVKRYTADLTVVKDFNVEIKDKEFMVLGGPSGCGKSTALRMLAGLEAISEGQIRIGDRVVNNVAAKDRDIAMVFQSYALYPHMSVYDNMAFPLQMAHMKKPDIDKRVRNASKILGLDNFLSRKPRALSGGQRQRVALGRAMGGGGGGGDCAHPQVLPARGATLQPGRQAARPDPGRAAEAAPRPGDDLHLRHPRPGRGDDDGGPDRDHERRHPAAGGDPG